VTTAPIPAEQFGTWLGELVTALQDADGTTSQAPGSGQSPTSPFAPGVGNFMHTIAQGFHGSANDFTRGRTQDSAQAIDHVHTSHAARAAAQLRNQIIHNLGSPSVHV
jgi:hypothetical protein